LNSSAGLPATRLRSATSSPSTHFSAFVPTVHRGDQQIGQAVGNLAPADVAEGGKQGQADRVGMPAQLVQFLGRDPAAVGEQHAGRHAAGPPRHQGANPMYAGLQI